MIKKLISTKSDVESLKFFSYQNGILRVFLFYFLYYLAWPHCSKVWEFPKAARGNANKNPKLCLDFFQ